MPEPLREDVGLLKIYSVCLGMSAVWRPTSCHDLGVDGQIEFLEPGTSISTGAILAIQSKSGSSYFRTCDDDYVYFYPEPKHRRYWRVLTLPVLLVLHNPDTDTTLYASAKPQLAERGPIRVSKRNLFEPKCRDALIKMSQEETLTILDPSRVLSKLVNFHLERPGHKAVTGIDFLLACTNRKARYFELRMCRFIALFSLMSEGEGVSIGQLDYDFILRNVVELHANRVVQDFLEEFSLTWFEFGLVPDIAVPLTNRGWELLEFLWNNLDRYLSREAWSHLGCTDVIKMAQIITDAAQTESDCLDRSDRMGIVRR